jgi:hypothetical protein
MRRQQTRGGFGVAGVEVKNFDSPDETRPFEGKGEARVVSIAARIVGIVGDEPCVMVDFGGLAQYAKR